MPRRLLILAMALLCAPTYARVVLVRTWPKSLYAFTKDTSAQWRVNDYVCFRRPPKPDHDNRDFVACGQIIRLTRLSMIVHVTGIKEPLRLADRLDPELMDAKGYFGNGLVDIRPSETTSAFERRNFSIGIAYPEPLIHLELGVARHLSVGLMPTYISMILGRVIKVRGISYNLVLNYYSSDLYDGFWGLLGGGWYFSGGGNPCAIGTVGWKFLTKSKVNFGVAGGFQFLSGVGTSGFIFPLGMAQLGYIF